MVEHQLRAGRAVSLAPGIAAERVVQTVRILEFVLVNNVVDDVCMQQGLSEEEAVFAVQNVACARNWD